LLSAFGHVAWCDANCVHGVAKQVAALLPLAAGSLLFSVQFSSTSWLLLLFTVMVQFAKPDADSGRLVVKAWSLMLLS